MHSSGIDQLRGNRTFLTLFAIGGLQSFTRWFELLAFGVYVFDRTQSAPLVAAVTLAKFAPLALFGPLFGAFSTRFTPRNLYLIGITAMIVVNMLGFWLASRVSINVPMVLAISFVGGLFWVLDFPVRRPLIGASVEPSILGKAMAIDTIANNGTRMLGPVLGGTLLQLVGLSGTFAIAIVVYVLCLLLTVSLSVGRSVTSEGSEHGLGQLIAGGGRLVKRQPLLLAILLVTVAYNLFGFPILSLVPVIGRDSLQLSPSLVGLLVSMEGTGAFLGSLLMLVLARIVDFRRLYTAGLMICFIASMAYAYLPNGIVIGLLLLTVGMGSAAFATMQSTLLILNSSEIYRTRLFGLLSLSIGTGLIGFTQIGLLAHFLNVRTAIFISALFGVISLTLICLRWPEIVANQDIQ